MTRLVGLTSVGHVVFAAALAQLGVPWWLAIIVAVASVAIFVNRANVYLRGAKRSRLSVALIDVPYFIHWTGGFIAIPLAIIFMALALCARDALFFIPRFAFPAAYLVGTVLAAYGAIFRRRAFAIERTTVEIPGLDPSLDGYRIAHLSDLHIGPWTPRAWGLRWVRAANALECDLAVVTGDLIMSGTAFHDDAADVVGALQAKDGVFVAMGNHDYDHGTGGEALVRAVESRGARVLRNEGVERRGLFVAGIDDRWSNRADLDRVFSQRPDNTTTVLLAHDPADFEGAAERGAHLVLSGHTHGGQLAVPFAARHANLGRLHRRHTLGVYQRGKSSLVVHPGLGTSGPPVRLGVAPAIVEITLRACGSLSESR